MSDLDVVLAKLEIEFPKFKIIYKHDSWLMRFISRFLWVCSMGKMSNFMDGFISVVGYTVYVPKQWLTLAPTHRAVILRHERVHMRQRVRYGAFLYSFLYLCFPLPIGLSYFRAKLEMEAYEETLKAICELYQANGVAIIQGKVHRDKIVNHFMGAQYFWMWPFRSRVEAWYDEAVRKAVSCMYDYRC